MVNSILNSDIKDYSESKLVDVEDIKYNTIIYEYNLFDTDIEIALGKPKYKYADKYNIIFFSIYLIYNDELKSRIGIFETQSNILPSIVNDESGSMDLSKGKIIIFIPQKHFFKLLNKKVSIRETILDKEDNEETEDNDNEEQQDQVEELDDETDVLMIDTKDAIKTTKEESELYVENMEAKKPTLPEETKEDSLKMNQ